MQLIAHRQFFGDREREFKLDPELILELERTTGTGIGELSRRVFGGAFRHRDLTETIRLGLIGGGETPEAAAALVRTYVHGRPLTEGHALAVAILGALWSGTGAGQDTAQGENAPEGAPEADSEGVSA